MDKERQTAKMTKSRRRRSSFQTGEEVERREER